MISAYFFDGNIKLLEVCSDEIGIKNGLFDSFFKGRGLKTVCVLEALFDDGRFVKGFVTLEKGVLSVFSCVIFLLF